MIHKFTLLEKLLLNFNVIPHPVLDALSYVVAGKGLQVGVRLGLFKELDKGHVSIDKLSKRLKIGREGLVQLIDVIEALGYVKRDKEFLIYMTKRGERFFSAESEFSMQNTVLFSDYVFNSLIKLEDNIRSGSPPDVNLDNFTSEQWGIFNKTMEELARSNTKEISGMIPLSKSHKRLLDIGGSHGLHAIEICKKLPGVSAEIMDLRPVRDFANESIKKNNMSARVKFRIGDFHKDELGTDYDIILAFNVIHGLNSEINQYLTDKIYRALNPGGVYVILDQIKGAVGKSDLSKLVSSTQGLMLFNVAGGRTYSFEEVNQWTKKTGFKRSEFKRLRAPGNALIISYK